MPRQLERSTYTAVEVATLLGVSRPHVYESFRRGELPGIKLGHRVVFIRHKIDALIGRDVPETEAR